MINVIRFVADHPDVRCGTLALAMGLNLDERGLAKAGAALRRARRFLETEMVDRVEGGLCDISAAQVGMTHTHIKETSDVSLVYPITDKEFGRGLQRGVLPIDETATKHMRSYGYIADPKDLSRDDRRKPHPSDYSHDGKRAGFVIGECLLEAHRVIRG